MAKDCIALAARDTSGIIKRINIKRRDVGPNDVEVDIHYSGVCRSDVHMVRSDWIGTNYYPMVPGHEIAGVVKSVGKDVKKFKPGDRVGVGVYVDSCRNCDSCKRGDESYCDDMVATYNTEVTDEKGNTSVTYGGYSASIVTDAGYVVSIPDNLGLDVAAPLLCAGITTYSPLRHFGALKGGPKVRVGIMGFGGLGHLALKLAKAMGCPTTVISTSNRKKDAALKCGADRFLVSTDEKQFKEFEGSMDLIINCVSADHDIDRALKLVANDGAMVLVGLPPHDFKVHPFSLVGRRITLAGSHVGGIGETQEMLDFCAKNNVFAEITEIPAKDVNRAIYELVSNSSTKNRFVINVKDSMTAGEWEVEDDDRIDPKSWKIQSKVVPDEAVLPFHK